MIEIEETSIPGVRIVKPRRFGDARGWFAETFNRRALAEAGIDIDFVQDNESLSAAPGTVRGLHFQTPDFAQTKLVRVLTGAILDVAVDIRRGSPTFGAHVAVELSAENGKQLLVPRGFAHGFCTLAPDTRVFYKVDAYYSEAHDTGLLWNDPALAIDWPVTPGKATLSEKDTRLPRLADFDTPFVYDAG
ncbi:MAG: dTDP-4-dehydrorhamnose 3,5-epimerase [Alphaproteobacteria bacterium HGW-Alphaproteobacteria-11]|nr:MAG: dTDP-4-dehydrorhamnose 3,5-epimerase [Alphaproteobacteria bacterium HGW-Alphaproteobacteria-11]